LKYLKPFDLYDNFEMEIEDVSGWSDNVFIKGKRERIFFEQCLTKIYENLTNILNEDVDFYKENLAKLIEKLNNLPIEVDFVTFYDL